jgi:hypothetical protein
VLRYGLKRAIGHALDLVAANDSHTVETDLTAAVLSDQGLELQKQGECHADSGPQRPVLGVASVSEVGQCVPTRGARAPSGSSSSHGAAHDRPSTTLGSSAPFRHPGVMTQFP